MILCLLCLEIAALVVTIVEDGKALEVAQQYCLEKGLETPDCEQAVLDAILDAYRRLQEMDDPCGPVCDPLVI